jgi:hypothetical protein
MKAMLFLGLFVSVFSFASASLEDVACFSNMSDGECRQSQTPKSYEAECFFTVNLALKNGEKVLATYTGNSSVDKNIYALISNQVVQGRAYQMAYEKMFKQIIPFFSLKTCD